MPTWINRDRFFQIFWVTFEKTFLVREGVRRGKSEQRELITFASKSRAKKEYRIRVNAVESKSTWRRVPAPSAPPDNLDGLPRLKEPKPKLSESQLDREAKRVIDELVRNVKRVRGKKAEERRQWHAAVARLIKLRRLAGNPCPEELLGHTQD